MSVILQFCNWLSRTPPSLSVQNNQWVIPSLQSIHILSIAVVLTSVSMLDLQLAGVIHRATPQDKPTARFLPWIWGGLIVLLSTGSLLILGEPERELTNQTFWLKMALLILAVSITVLLERFTGDAGVGALPPSRRWLVKILALVSLAAWVGVAICGRGIAYTVDA